MGSLALALLLTTSLLAQTNATKPYAFSNVKDNFIFSYHGEYNLEAALHKDTNASVKAPYKLNHFSYLQVLTVGYKLAQDWSLTTSLEFRYTNKDKVLFVLDTHKFTRGLVAVTKKNVLREADAGVQLDLGYARRYNDPVYSRGSYGNDRLNAKLTKNFGKNNASLFAQYLTNDPKFAQIKNTTWRRAVQLVPTINIQLTENLTYTFVDDFTLFRMYNDLTVGSHSMIHEMQPAVFTYQFNDKLSVFASLKYNYAEAPIATTNAYDLGYGFGAGYNFLPKLTLTGEVSSDVFASNDHKIISEGALKPKFLLSIDYSL